MLAFAWIVIFFAFLGGLLIRRGPARGADPQKAGSFVAWLESTGDFVVRSRQPLVDGARELLARG
jgi:hypothetical protein